MSAFSRQQLVVALALGTAALAASPAAAQQTFTNQLSMQVMVEATCSVGGDTLDFGTYTNNQSEALTETATITFADCPVGSIVTLGAGGASGELFRRMTNASDEELPYNLYTDSGHNDIWPTATAGAPTIDSSGEMTVYGRIPANRDVAAGSYSNVVTITVAVN